MALAGSYEYFDLNLAGQDYFLDPENDISFGEKESKDIMIQRPGRPMLTAVKRNVTLTIDGMFNTQASALNSLKETEMQAVVNGSKSYQNTAFGTFILTRNYVENVTPAASYSSYGLNIHRAYEVILTSTVFT